MFLDRLQKKLFIHVCKMRLVITEKLFSSLFFLSFSVTRELIAMNHEEGAFTAVCSFSPHRKSEL
jgi:hypothetical protein